MNPAGNSFLQGGGGISLGGNATQGGAGTATLQNASSTPPAAGTSFLQPAGKVGATQAPAQAGSGNAALDAFNAQSAKTNAFYSQMLAQEKANAPGVGATLDINGLQAQASANASKTVNPLYDKYLNQYLQNAATAQETAKAQNTMNLQSEQASLANTLGTNQLQQTQATKQNELQQGNINAQAQNYQLMSGNAQNQKLSALRQSVGQGGLGASGMGQQQLYEAENAKNVADAAQAGQFQFQREQGNLSTQDTFDQLALQSQQATGAEGRAEAQTNFNLNDYLRQASAHDQAVQEQIEASRQQAQTSAQQNLLAQGVQGQINNLKLSSKDIAATNQKYSPYLQTSSAPSLDIASLINGGPQAGSTV